MTLLSGDSTVLYGGVYRAVCLEVLADRVRVQVPQLFADETVTIFEFAGPRPNVGDLGWVSFEAGRPERPIWVGTESAVAPGGGATGPAGPAGPPGPPGASITIKGSVPSAPTGLPPTGSPGDAWVSSDTGHLWTWSGTAWVDAGPFASTGGAPAWPPYKVLTSAVSIDNATTGNTDITLLDGSYHVAHDGWVEMLVGGGYAGNSTVSVNARQGVYSPSLLDPTSQPWIAFGYMASPAHNAWESIGDCLLSLPVTAGQALVAYWRGNWAPSTAVCSFRGNVSIKFYSAAGQPVAVGPVGPQGPPGPPGSGGAGGGFYHHVQSTAATTWTIVHNLGFFPNVTVVDSSHREVVGEVVYTDANTVTVTFSAAFGGDAYLS